MNTKNAKMSRPRVVVVNRALVIDKDEKVLLIKRVKNDPYMPGKWELPGGKLDSGQDISNALEREVLEETGLVIIPTNKVVYWHSEIISSGKYKGLPYIVLVGVAKPVGGRVRLSEEHEEYAWLSREEFFDYDLVPQTRSALSVLEGTVFSST